MATSQCTQWPYLGFLSIPEFSEVPQLQCDKGKKVSCHSCLREVLSWPLPMTADSGALIYTSLCYWKQGPRGSWHYLDYTMDHIESSFLNKVLRANEKTSREMLLWKAQTSQIENVLGLAFHNFRPKRTQGKKEEQLFAHHWAGRPNTSSWRFSALGRGWLTSDHRRPSAHPGVLTTAIFHRWQQLKGPKKKKSPLKTVTSRWKKQWIINSTLTQNKIAEPQMPNV